MPTAKPIGLLFPGQGSHVVGMGQALAEAFTVAEYVLDRAEEAFGGGLIKLMQKGPTEDLTLTTNAQPAILTASIMAWSCLRAAVPMLPKDLLPIGAAAGHSLGEFSALVAAGAITLEDAIPLVRDRGAYMQDAVPPGVGAMGACIAEVAPVEALVAAVVAEGTHGVLTIANYNGPGQTVISGHATALKRAIELGPDHGVKRIMELTVSAPFHCPLMAPAQNRFANRLQDVEFDDLRFPVITNLEATANEDPDRLTDLLTQQITSPVRWTEVCEALLARGITTFVECGAGGILNGMLKRGWKDRELTLLTVSDPENLEKTVDTLKEQFHV